MYLEDLDITPHKKRMLKLRFEGHSYGDIAAKFGVSPKTVEAHISQIYVKYDVTGLIQLANKFGWIRVSLKHSDPLDTKPNIALTSPPPSC